MFYEYISFGDAHFFKVCHKCNYYNNKQLSCISQYRFLTPSASISSSDYTLRSKFIWIKSQLAMEVDLSLSIRWITPDMTSHAQSADQPLVNKPGRLLVNCRSICAERTSINNHVICLQRLTILYYML